MKVWILPIGVAALVMASGCITNRIGDFTILSTKNIDLNNPQGFRVDSSKRLTGSDIRFGSIPNIKEAVDKAVQSEAGCIGLSDVVLYVVQRPFSQGYKVDGNPIYLRANATAAAEGGAK